MVLMLCPSWVEGRKGRSQPRLRTIVDDDEELCINDAESVRRRTRAGNGSKGSKVNQYEELYPPVSTTTPNEDILPTLDMIDIFQLGTFGSFPNGTLLGLLENDISKYIRWKQNEVENKNHRFCADFYLFVLHSIPYSVRLRCWWVMLSDYL